ncbi:hypothetical protein [Rathayibacter oskolensis]|uniref:hypothetical protein n=1 Tax=Rathayibacter oskolensis TaxID=1891671 RepID=UPI0034652216
MQSRTGHPRDPARARPGDGHPIGAYLEEASTLPTGGFTVVHLSTEHPGSGIVSLETHAPLT